jgi:hypothetical protein
MRRSKYIHTASSRFVDAVHTYTYTAASLQQPSSVLSLWLQLLRGLANNTVRLAGQERLQHPARDSLCISPRRQRGSVPVRSVLLHGHLPKALARRARRWRAAHIYSLSPSMQQIHFFKISVWTELCRLARVPLGTVPQVYVDEERFFGYIYSKQRRLSGMYPPSLHTGCIGFLLISAN